MCDRRLLHSLLVVTSVLGIGAVFAAGPPSDRAPSSSLFTRLPSEETGITFSNTLQEGPRANVLAYEYFYNGGGVAAGDLNGDGRPDLYFTSNQGNLRFEDVSTAWGLAQEGFSTGAAYADFNNDAPLSAFSLPSSP